MWRTHRIGNGSRIVTELCELLSDLLCSGEQGVQIDAAEKHKHVRKSDGAANFARARVPVPRSPCFVPPWLDNEYESNLGALASFYARDCARTSADSPFCPFLS